MPIVIIEPTLKGRERVLLETALPGMQLVVVTDPNTFAVLGERIFGVLPPETHHIALEAEPKATLAQAEAIAGQVAGDAALLAVGSGTINDLCKYAAHRRGIPYAVCATAPSMNGYVSGNASLVGGRSSGSGVQGGMKRSFPATPPVAVLCDLEVLAAAPVRLILSGLGDSLCRPTAQADWLLSHLLLGTPYTEEPFALLAPHEPQLFAQADRLARGDMGAVECLMRVLLASGEGMQLAGGSYPASQGEHMIAHSMEALYGAALPPSYHGEQIGVTTLTMARRQEAVLNMSSSPELRSNSKVIQKGEGLYYLDSPRIFPEKNSGNDDAKKRRDALNKKFAANWEQWRMRIQDVTLPSAQLEAILHSAGAPTTPQALGWCKDEYRRAVEVAPATRDRFTFLNLE